MSHDGISIRWAASSDCFISGASVPKNGSLYRSARKTGHRAYQAGIRHMIFVTGRNKRAIEDHFDTAYELETELEQAGKAALLSVVCAA